MSSRRLVLYAELKAKFGIPYTREHISRLAKVGKFPPKIRLSHRCIGFYEDLIVSWVDERATASAAGAGTLAPEADDPPPSEPSGSVRGRRAAARTRLTSAEPASAGSR